MKRVEGVHPVALANDHNYTLAHGEEFWMWHDKLAPVGQANLERLEPIGDPLTNTLDVHAESIVPP